MLALLDAGSVRLEDHGRRADVVLDAPATLNAQTPATWRALAAAAHWLDGRADVVVVRAQGRAFSAGLDRRAFTADGIPGELNLAELASRPDAELDAAIDRWQQGFAGLATGSFISIAAVRGHAVGAGFQLALACDLRIAAEDARFAMREPLLGLVPDLGGTKALLDAVGYPRAVELCTTGRQIDAQEALAFGVVQSVVPADGLESAVDALVDGVLAADPAAVAATKRLLRAAGGNSPAEQLAAERRAQVPLLRKLTAGRAVVDGGA